MGLTEYGIMQEDSDIRAHVAVLARIVYVFRTKDARELLGSSNGKYQPRKAYQRGVTEHTAEGYAVPVSDIKCIPVGAGWLIDKERFAKDDSTSAKGAKAVNVVTGLLRVGWFPLLGVNAAESTDRQVQIFGTDIIVVGKWKIQVKCDYAGGVGSLCTGRLFLQLRESNPLKAR